MLAARAENLHIEVEPLDLYLIPLSTAAREMAFEIAIDLRRRGFIVDLSFGERGLKGAMKAADKSGARFSAVLGEDEMASQNISLKDMKTGSSREVRIGDLFKSLQNEEK